MESLTLTTPETKPANPAYVIAGIREDWDGGSIEIVLRGTNGERRTVLYGPQGAYAQNGNLVAGSPTGFTILRQQNKADFTVTSRVKKIYQRLSADFPELAGAITGVPD